MDTPDGPKTFGITRAHLEEDAGKSVHGGADSLAGSSHTLVDFNRAGARAVPRRAVLGCVGVRLRAPAPGWGGRRARWVADGRVGCGAAPQPRAPARSNHLRTPCALRPRILPLRPAPGVPLLEIVSEPDMRSGRDAALYGAELRRVMRFLGISDGNMAEGSMRCDVNVRRGAWGGEGGADGGEGRPFEAGAFERALGRDGAAGGRVLRSTQPVPDAARLADATRRPGPRHLYRTSPLTLNPPPPPRPAGERAAQGPGGVWHQGGGQEHEQLQQHAEGHRV